MLLDLILDGILTDSNIGHLDSNAKGIMLSTLATEYAELWQSFDSPASGDAGIAHAVSEQYAFNTLEFYRIATQAATRVFKRITRMIKDGSADHDAHDRISYQALLELEIDNAKQAAQQWNDDHAVDVALAEIAAQIKADQ